MKLVLHIGAHKTATTTIQGVFAKNRAALASAGVWYPAYSEVFPGARDHYAHLDVAKGLMSDSNRFGPEQVAEFFRLLHDRAQHRSGVDTVLISAEPFYRGCMAGEQPYWQRRAEYVAKLKEIVPFDDVDVVLVVRRQDDYLESLYNEHVKVTRYSKGIWDFLQEFHARFEYRNQIEVWSKYFSSLVVLTYEELVANKNPASDFLIAVAGPRNVVLEDLAGESNVSLPVDLVEFKRNLNGTSVGRPKLRELVPILESVAKARAEDKSSRMSRLSIEDRKRILTEFESDNDWLRMAYFPEREGALFPAEFKNRPIASELTLQSCVDIMAEVIKRVPLGK